METEMINSLSKGQKIALWIVLIWVAFCFLGSLGNGWLSLVLVCIALFVAILCLLKGTLDAKYAWAVFAISLIVPFVMAAALATPENEKAKQEETKGNESKEQIDKEKSTKDQAEKKDTKQKQQLSPKEKEVAEAGSHQGTMFGMAGASNDGFSDMLDMADYVEGMDDKVNEMFEEMAGGEYDKQYGAPSNAEEKKLKKIYIEHFVEALNSAMDAMDNVDKLGGKR